MVHFSTGLDSRDRRRRCAINLGSITTVSASTIVDAIASLERDPHRLQQMFRAAYGVLNDRIDISEMMRNGN